MDRQAVSRLVLESSPGYLNRFLHAFSLCENCWPQFVVIAFKIPSFLCSLLHFTLEQQQGRCIFSTSFLSSPPKLHLRGIQKSTRSAFLPLFPHLRLSSPFYCSPPPLLRSSPSSLSALLLSLGLIQRDKMGNQNMDSGSPGFQSNDHAHLLNVIDQLRSIGIERYVALPQLIICGEQSAGKSSALEAISGVRFPTKEGLCTRFATEVILRRDPQESSKAHIIPSEKRSNDEQALLKGFERTVNLDGDFPAMIDEVMTVMGLSSDSKELSEDVLRVEISGPDQPHLTLVDHPGLYHSGPGSDLVKELVRRYMRQKRSIILAVVSARNDVELQLVTEMTTKINSKGLRTLGIITKPDEIKDGAEKQFLDLARNHTVHLRLGWHVHKNRDFTENETSRGQRDETERQFFP